MIGPALDQIWILPFNTHQRVIDTKNVKSSLLRGLQKETFAATQIECASGRDPVQFGKIECQTGAMVKIGKLCAVVAPFVLPRWILIVRLLVVPTYLLHARHRLYRVAVA